MVIYVPGTEETDPKKQNMSLQQIAGAASTAIANVAINTTNIATNTTNIATNTTNIASNTSAISALQALVPAPKITASLGADVLLNNTANYFDGPSVAQGTSGTWFATGTITLIDTAAVSGFNCKLWDGTTVIASAFIVNPSAGFTITISLSGVLASPAGNIRISCRDITATSGKILFNSSGNSKDSTITAMRIG